MSDAHSLRLVSSRPAPSPAHPAPGSARYRVTIDRSRGAAPDVRVIDRSTGRLLLSWRGRVAAKLLSMDALALQRRQTGGFYCDKPLLQRLAMAGAAAERQVNGSLPEHTPERIAPAVEATRASDVTDAGRRSALHAVLLSLLEEFPKQHLAEDDIVCLLQFRLPCIAAGQVRAALSDLAGWNDVQPIRVPTGAIHYDLDTRPHLHVFDARTKQLRDAPACGVLQVAATEVLPPAPA